jgi:hypothetical protein
MLGMYRPVIGSTELLVVAVVCLVTVAAYLFFRRQPPSN